MVNKRFAFLVADAGSERTLQLKGKDTDSGSWNLHRFLQARAGSAAAVTAL